MPKNSSSITRNQKSASSKQGANKSSGGAGAAPLKWTDSQIDEFVETGYKVLMSEEFLGGFENLMSHQKDGVKWLIKSYLAIQGGDFKKLDKAREGGVLLADEPGLGKTLTVREHISSFLIIDF